MKFITSRDVRNNPTEFREAVEREDVVLTVGGKPFAVAIGVREEELEDVLELLRRLRALRGMARMQEKAEKSGAQNVSMEEIDKEVKAARKARRRSA